MAQGGSWEGEGFLDGFLDGWRNVLRWGVEAMCGVHVGDVDDSGIRGGSWCMRCMNWYLGRGEWVSRLVTQEQDHDHENMSQHVRIESLNTNRTHVEHLPHDQRHKESNSSPPPPHQSPSLLNKLTYTHSVPIIPTPASTPPPPRPAIPTPTPTLLLLLLRMRVPAQRANDRAAQRPDAGP